MAKPQEKAGSTAVRPIAPPPLSQHLRELASRPDAWAVLARNLIPVVGIYVFGWSAALAVFNYWFDGFFFQAEVGIRVGRVTGVQTCALPISPSAIRRPMMISVTTGVPAIRLCAVDG